MRDAVLGVDIGTSSSKGVLVDLSGRILAIAVRHHDVSRPGPGQVEMSAQLWWQEFTLLSRELLQRNEELENPASIVGVGVSGMGPCVCVADGSARPLRPAILYGVDTRATAQIDRLTVALGADEIVDRCGSALSSQSVGPKLAWIADHEPDIAASAQMLFMPSNWLVFQLTGEYILDHHSASQCTPLYDTLSHEWYEPWAQQIAAGILLPRLVWPGDIVGRVTADASLATGLPVGVPVIGGTIDAWAEAISVDAQKPGDLMLMYGTTLFLVNTRAERATSSSLWGTVGAFEGTYNLAGGLAASGAITSWLRTLTGSPDFGTLTTEADASGPGARGLLMLPYFAGERTPIADPQARGVIAGLTLDHTRGDLYRAALEATAFGVRHNVEALEAAGGTIERTTAVGGGTQGGVWTQIVSDVSGLTQHIPRVTTGASFGAAYLAASALSEVSISSWNPIESIISPRESNTNRYEDLYDLYRDLYGSTSSLVHRLAEMALR